MFGLQLPIQTLTRSLIDPWEDDATPADLLAITQACEQAGLGFVGVCDHIAIPDDDYAAHMTTTWYDTVSTLSWLGGQTETIELLSIVYIVGYRHPLTVAKSWGTLDHLTGGRAILGVGIGHVENEFKALGVDYKKRGKLLDESLRAIRGAFDDTYVSHDGEFWSYEDVGVGPPPPDGDLTIWVAGGGKAAFRRVGQYGNGFIPFANTKEDYADIVPAIRAEAEKAGRGDEQFDIGMMPGWLYLGDAPDDVGPFMVSGTSDEIAAEMIDCKNHGANVLHVRFRSRDAQEYIDQVLQFGAEVIPAVESA